MVASESGLDVGNGVGAGVGAVVVVDTPPGLLDNKSSACRLDHGEKIQPSSSRTERNYPLVGACKKIQRKMRYKCKEIMMSYVHSKNRSGFSECRNVRLSSEYVEMYTLRECQKGGEGGGGERRRAMHFQYMFSG